MNAIDTSTMQRGAPALLLGSPAPQEPLGVPVGRIFRVLRRRGWIALLVTALVTGAAAAVVMRMEPNYTAQASVLVETRRSQLNDLQVSAPEVQETSTVVQTQIDIMRSPALIQGVVRALDLTAVPEFDPPPGLIGRLQAMLGRVPAVPTMAERELNAAGILAGKLSFAAELRSSVVRISAETGDAARSAAIVNELARGYLDYSRERKFATLQRAVSWFQTRLSELAVQVQAGQAAVQRYREEHNLADTPIVPSGPGQVSVQAQRLADVNRQLTEVIGERARREAQVNEVADRLRRQGRPAGLPEVPGNLLAELNAYRAQEATLRQAVARARQEVVAENAATSQMAGLVAQAQASRAMYDSFLSRATGLANAEGVQEPDAELISPGVVPNGPSSPKRGRLLGVAFGFSLLLGLGLALLSDRMRSGIGNLADAEAALGVRALAVVPQIRGGRRTMVRNARRDRDYQAAMQRILSALLLSDQGARPKVVTITSALPQEGKSLMAQGLAETAVRAGLRVLLIDGDMRRPTLMGRLDLKAERGLTDVLTSSARLDDVVAALPSGLFVIPSVGSAARLPHLLASAPMRNLLNAARSSFDLVLIDTPPLLPVLDALQVAQHSDAVVLAARWESTPTPLMQEAVRLLQQAGAPIAGVALTRAKLRSYARSTTEGAAFVHRRFRHYYQIAP